MAFKNYNSPQGVLSIVRDSSGRIVDIKTAAIIFPKSKDETDPIYSASAASGITTGNIANWNTAFGWGNHALAGYASSSHNHDLVYAPIVHSHSYESPLGNPLVDGYVLASTAAGVRSWVAQSGGISGLTIGYLPKAASGTSINNSLIYTTGTRVALNKTVVAPSPTQALEINFGHILFNSIPGPTLGTWAAALSGTGAGNVDNGIHYYYCKYVGEYGTTGYESAEISVTVVDKTLDGKVQLTGIPIAPAGYGVTARKLYRTVAGAGNRYIGRYLATIGDNTTTTYLDNIADSSLSTTDTYYVSPNTTTGKMYRGGTVIFFVEQFTSTVGWGAGANITTGGSNALFGSYAGQSLTQGSGNSFFGAGSVGSLITTGGSNSAFGASALRGAAGTTSCVAIGSSSLQNCGGNGVVGLGTGSGLRVTTGSYSTFIGHGSGQLLQAINPQYSSTLGAFTYTYKDYQTMIGALDGAGIMLPSSETIHNGDIHIRRTNTLGAEVLANPNLTSGTNWAVTNDAALTADTAKWTFSAGTVSTLTQLSSAFATALKGNRWYRFVYTVSGVTGTITHPIASITTGVANESYNIYVSANGTYYVYFKTKASPGNFVITATLTTGQSFTLDTFSLKEVIGGDIYVNKDVYVNDKIGVGTITPTAPISVAEKGAINEYGGFMIKLTNRTGGNSVKGEVVMASHTYANAVTKIVVDEPDPIGVFYESGVANGSEAWIVVSGIADVYFIGNTALGDYARGFITGDAGYVSGQALAEALPTAPFATDKHFYEIGHVLESRTGAGLAKCVLHFN